MDKKVLNKHLEKLNEDIRNIQYQINSINQDIKKDKKQSYIEKRIDNGQTEAISELMNQIRLYENLKNRAEYILERTLKNK